MKSFKNRLQAVWVGVLALSVPFTAGAGYFGAPVGPQLGLLAGAVPQAMPISSAALAFAPGDDETDKSPTTKPSSGKAAVPNQPFAVVKARADKMTSPIEGVAIWQKFIDNGATGTDLEKAEAELAIWIERNDDDAAIINKVWVGGKEREQVQEKVQQLIGEFQALQKKSQTVEAIEKLKEAAKVWPENYVVTFELGFIALDKADYKEAVQKFEFCQRLAPNSPAVLNNLGLCYLLAKPVQNEKSIMTLVKSVKAKDTRENVTNLGLALGVLNPNMAKAPKYKEARELFNLLADRHEVKEARPSLMRLQSDSGVDTEKGSNRNDKEQVVGNGSGFVISPDGYILTNKHVGGAGSGVLIKFNDGTQKTGEIVVIDDEQDLALIKVKSDKPFSYVKMAKYDNPRDAETCVVMGFPVSSITGWVVKTTVGRVAAGNNNKPGSDVTLDVRINPGNSGGPVYDQYGNIMAIVAQKSMNATMSELGAAGIDSYGLAISAGRIRRFFAKNNIKPETAEIDDQTPLQPDQIAERNKMATVCIMIIGKPPTEQERKSRK